MERPRVMIEREAEASAVRPMADRRLAVVDVGSNTARLVVFQTAPGGFLRAIYETKESPRLGLGVGPDGSISREAFDRGLAGLTRFAQTLKAFGLPKTVGVATSAVRDAPNGRAFVEKVEKETGIELRVLSGTEEARYAYLGVSSSWELESDLICDLGGGSLQVAATRKGLLQNSVSLPLGALRLTQRFFEHDPPKGREVEALREHVHDGLRDALEAIGRERWRLFGVGGTVRSLAKVAIDLREYPIPRVHGFPLRAHDLEALGELLFGMPAEKRSAVPGIGTDRADVIVAGLVVIEELVRTSAADLLTVSGTGIREGLALEEVHAQLPATAEELARRSVEGASEALAFSVAHGEEVEHLARQLFNLLSKRSGWGEEERRALTVAAWMHDAGTAIDLWRHARHSAYLVRNVPLWGLSQREILLASMIAFLHEGDTPPSSWRRDFLPLIRGSDIELARQLGTLLYVAETLRGGDPKFTLPEGSETLGIALGRGGETGLSPKVLEKVRKPLRREFHLEVKARDS
ncbi:MAG TPA: Ppx/GppA phosphatase family protein [Thermoplasmata archaeon]|nr:Ppx/GppA phosphatase family protein [Thermoplasmata archaeon]